VIRGLKAGGRGWGCEGDGGGGEAIGNTGTG